MLKGIAKLVIILAAAGLVDQYFYNGLYTDAVFSMLRQMRHSFQW